jgi:benzoyl-CoA reductase/2-hydroxyglutaryl-CoA dehydratase subunit BcrC/BadD/HgdB
VKNDKFFVTQIDPPIKDDDTSLAYYKQQLKLKVVDELEKRFGVDVSEAAMRKAIDDHNEISRVITEIGDFRKLDNPPITGYEFHVIELVSQVCPHYLILPYLQETLEELKTREPEPKFPFRTRVAVVGSEIDDPEFTKLIESCGAMVVADRYCFGSFPGREQIAIEEGESAFDAICRHYLHWNQCARFMDGKKIDQRHDEVLRLVKEYKAQGVIYESMKFCEFWSYEKVLANHIFTNELHIPCCTIEKEYALGAVGQLRTRFQAFIESLEIKSIQGGK